MPAQSPDATPSRDRAREPQRRVALLVGLIATVLAGLSGGAFAAAQPDPTPAVVQVREATPVSVGTPVGGDRPAGIRIGPGSGVATGASPTLTVSGIAPGDELDLRVYRLEVAEGAVARLPGLRYTLVTVEAGAVRVADAEGAPGDGQLVEANSGTGSSSSVSVSVSVSGSGSFGTGPGRGISVAWAEGAPAAAWVATLVRADEADPAVDDSGVTVTHVGGLRAPSIPGGASLEIRLDWTGASPIPYDLDQSQRSVPTAGVAPAALLVARDAGITLTGPDGSARELPVGEALELADARGYAVTGPLEDYRDEPLRYAVITARAVETDRFGGPLAGTPGAGSVGTPQPVTIPDDALRWDGPPVACDLEPVTLAELEEAPNLFLATPELAERLSVSGLDGVPGSGQPADQATIDGILRTLGIADACATVDDPARLLRLYSPPLLALLVTSIPSEDLDILIGGPGSGSFTRATPTAEPQPVRAWQIEVLPDGRVGAYLSAVDGSVSYTAFILGPDGLWLIDAFEPIR